MKNHTKEDIKNKNECTGKSRPKNVKLSKVKFLKPEFIDQKFNFKKFSDNQMSIDDYYLSPENAAKYLDVSRKFIYELIQSKTIEAVSLGRKLKRIQKRTLDNWLNLQTTKFER